jgi:hypothetical protein
MIDNQIMNPLVEKTVIELRYESIDKFFHQKLVEGVQQKIDNFTKEVVKVILDLIT